MIETRCSYLPQAVACPASLQAPVLRIVGDDESAAIGTGVHTVMSHAVVQGRLDAEDVETTSRMLAPDDRDEFKTLCWLAWRNFESLAKWFPEPQTEVHLDYLHEGWALDGHLDILSIVDAEGEARILDHKTGRLDLDHRHQMMGYAWLVVETFPQVKLVRCWVSRVRDGQADYDEWTSEQLDVWHSETRRKLESGAYVPAKTQCSYCPRGHDCPAKAKILQNAVVALLPGLDAIEVLDGLPADLAERGPILAKLLDRAKLVKKICEEAEALVKADVKLQGPMPTGDGRKLCIVPQKQRRIVACEASAYEVEQATSADALWSCITIGKGKVEDAVKAVAPPKKGAANVREILSRLEAAGLLTETVVERLETRRMVEQIEVDV